jgi:hypothetical protein
MSIGYVQRSAFKRSAAQIAGFDAFLENRAELLSPRRLDAERRTLTMSASSKSPLNRLGALLIRALVWFGPVTRTRLGELTGFTRGQTNRLLEDLYARGWIVFGDELRSPVGRPAVRVSLNPSLGWFLSVTLEDDTWNCSRYERPVDRTSLASAQYFSSGRTSK